MQQVLSDCFWFMLEFEDLNIDRISLTFVLGVFEDQVDQGAVLDLKGMSIVNAYENNAV